MSDDQKPPPPKPPPKPPPEPPHVHQVASYQQVGRDRVGYCSCLDECARQVNYYDD